MIFTEDKKTEECQASCSKVAELEEAVQEWMDKYDSLKAMYDAVLEKLDSIDGDIYE